jgi:hypothetical protein
MTDLVQCPYCGRRYPGGATIICCSELHCFPVTQDTLDAEAREHGDGLRSAAEDEKFQRMREEGV